MVVICERLRAMGTLSGAAKLFFHTETHLDSAPLGLFDSMSVSSRSSCAGGGTGGAAGGGSGRESAGSRVRGRVTRQHRHFAHCSIHIACTTGRGQGSHRGNLRRPVAGNVGSSAGPP